MSGMGARAGGKGPKVSSGSSTFELVCGGRITTLMRAGERRRGLVTIQALSNEIGIRRTHTSSPYNMYCFEHRLRTRALRYLVILGVHEPEYRPDADLTCRAVCWQRA